MKLNEQVRMMKKLKEILPAMVLLLSSGLAMGQVGNPKYDAELAEKLGADDYGMKNYIFVLLKSGDNNSTDKQFRDSCFSGHMENIGRLAEMNKLIVAGPFGPNDDDMRGIFILDVASLEEAEELMDTDPAINAGFLKALLYPWYGSAALPEYLEAADRIWKKGI